MDIFLVTSVIHTPNKPLSYSEIRSTYTPEERFVQTQVTIKSIREKVPNVYVVVIEGSKGGISTEWSGALGSDHVHYFEHPDVYGLYKARGETVKIIDYLESQHYNSIKNNIRRLFKLSGRYILTDNFVLEEFPLNKLGVKIQRERIFFNTQLYSIPSVYLDWYLEANKQCLLKDEQNHLDLEIMLFSSLLSEDSDKFINIKILGVGGVAAPDPGRGYHES
jgi:hypothetical protein